MTRATRSGRTHRAERLIRADPGTIYAAWLDPVAMAAWRPPLGMRMRVDRFEPRVGGAFRLTLEYEGPDGRARGKSSDRADIVAGRFAELVPGRRIVELVEFESDDPAFAGTMKVTTTLAAAEGGTEVEITCADVPPGIGESDHVAGISSTLEQLARYLE